MIWGVSFGSVGTKRAFAIINLFLVLLFLQLSTAIAAENADDGGDPDEVPGFPLPDLPFIDIPLPGEIPELPIPPAACTEFDRPDAISIVQMEIAYPNLTFANATAMVVRPDRNDVWYISRRQGLVDVFNKDPDVQTSSVVLDIRDRVEAPAEKNGNWGIQSLAFHPDFANNGQLYVTYNTNDSSGNRISILSRFTSHNSQDFDAGSEEILIYFTHSNYLHGIGQLQFGPDGYLYVGMGDGGRSVFVQDMNDFRGKILRIDVNAGFPYGIPADNPFVGTGAAEEIYALGFRNPWRFSFDRVTGKLYAGNVGHNTWEEIELIEPGGNYGWPIMEGAHCFEDNCDTSGLKLPIYEYSHEQGCAVIGGHVYRGSAIPELQGMYLFGDHCASELRGLKLDESPPNKQGLDNGLISTTGFGEDHDGELYTLSLLTGNIHKIVPASEDNDFLNPLPATLSETGCFAQSQPPEVIPRIIPYDINSPLWSDNAEKRRWMSLPRFSRITLDDDGDFQFPIGTVLIKEFAYDDVPFETRLFIRHNDGLWAGYSYEWRDDGTDADLLVESKTKTVGPDIEWTFPSRDQCLECHTAGAGFSLGPEVAQLNRLGWTDRLSQPYHQLRVMDRIRLFKEKLETEVTDLPTLTAVDQAGKAVATRARSYLHANCSGCHRPGGTTPVNIDFRFQTPVGEMNLCNIEPSAGALGLSNPYLIDPGNPDNSIVPLRMSHTDEHRMPPLGTTLVHQQALQVINEWISDPSVCDTKPDSDGDGSVDEVDNCPAIANVDQRDTDADGIGNICDGDINNDDSVDRRDLLLLSRRLFSRNPDADLDGDGRVGLADFRRLMGMLN